MNIIGVDDKKAIIITLEKMLKKIDPNGQHRFYTNPLDVVDDLDKPIDTAFLDIEMPEMNGVELAKRIIQRYPQCNIIFLTGHTEYMLPAFDIHSSGYLVKPFSLDMVRDALEHRRYRDADPEKKPVKVQCFGSFEVFSKKVPYSSPEKRPKSFSLF